MTLTQLREAINNADDNFGVTANIIDTGTAAGPRLVFSSSETGDGNDLVITNDTGAAELDRLSTTGGTANISAVLRCIPRDPWKSKTQRQPQAPKF